MKSIITLVFIYTSFIAWSQVDSLTSVRNAGVQSKNLEYERSKEKKFQETTLPNLEITAGAFLKPMVLPMGNQVAQFTAMQMFPWFGTYEPVRKEAAAMEDVAYQQYIAERNEVNLKLNVSVLRLYNLKKKKELEQKRLTLLKGVEDFQIAQFASAGKSQGTTSQMGMSNKTTASTGMSQLLRTRMEIKGLENELNTLADAYALESIRFNLLLNNPQHNSIELPDTMVLFTAPLRSSFENSPMIKMVEAEKRAAESNEQMAIKMGAPMIGAGLNYMVMTKPAGGDFPMADGKDMIMPMISVSLPIYRKKFTALKKEAQLAQSSLTKKLEQTQNDLMFEFEEAQRMRKIAERNLSLAQEQIELAENTVRLLLSEYAANQTSYDQVLRMQSEVLMLKINAIEAVVEYNTAISKLEFLVNSY